MAKNCRFGLLGPQKLQIVEIEIFYFLKQKNAI